MCVALGCAYQMNGFIVNRVLRSIARERLVLALAQERGRRVSSLVDLGAHGSTHEVPRLRGLLGRNTSHDTSTSRPLGPLWRLSL